MVTRPSRHLPKYRALPNDGIIDEVAIELFIKGEDVTLTQLEKWAVFCTLRERGLWRDPKDGLGDTVPGYQGRLGISGHTLKKFHQRWEQRMQGITPEEIYERMGYHPATPQTAPMHNDVRDKVIALALEVIDLVPAGREQSLVVTHLEEALMWANKAIARLTPVDRSTPAVARVLPDSTED